jgi:hypothetical protein
MNIKRLVMHPRKEVTPLSDSIHPDALVTVACHADEERNLTIVARYETESTSARKSSLLVGFGGHPTPKETSILFQAVERSLADRGELIHNDEWSDFGRTKTTMFGSPQVREN